jgi:purine-nucleoside phosphorylase
VSLHIEAAADAVADTVLLPGDPLRAKFAAETYLENPVCYNRVRGMLGFTGTWRGRRVSIQGTGMGVPSISIYAHELIHEYGAKQLIRIGTCGAISPAVTAGTVILASAASTDSAVNRATFGEASYAPAADFGLLRAAVAAAEARTLRVSVGTVFTSDSFYHGNPEYWKVWADFGVLAVEMETSALYTLAARNGVRALSILTVSDSLVDGASAPAEVRERGYGEMIELALELCL